MPHTITGSHLIEGKWLTSAPTFSAINPATGQPLTPAICEAGESEIGMAMIAAQSAFKRTTDLPPTWSADLALGLVELGDSSVPGGILHCATDWPPYAEAMADALESSSMLKKSDERDAGSSGMERLRPVTKFEARGRRADRPIVDLVYFRTESAVLSV